MRYQAALRPGTVPPLGVEERGEGGGSITRPGERQRVPLDVLSAFFFLLTLWSYARYVELKSLHAPRSSLHYALTLLLFACGLMSKPMVVTLPFVLLLLDV